jgi:hypothetical protein
VYNFPKVISGTQQIYKVTCDVNSLARWTLAKVQESSEKAPNENRAENRGNY